jgi:hypothetical protein
MRTQLLALVVGAVALGIAAPAGAAGGTRCDVLAIEASNAHRGVDPALAAALGRHAAVLAKPPFNAFDSFRLESRKAYDLELGQALELTLPTPFSGRLAVGGQAQAKLDLTLDIVRPGSQPVRINGRARPGAPLFAAGFASAKGTWIFGVICDRPASPAIVQH